MGKSMLTLLCTSCGHKAAMPDDSRLILVRAPHDEEEGLDHFFLYCRSCHMVSDLIGGTSIERPFDSVGIYDPAEVYRKHPETFGIFAPKIQDAMREDGIIS